MEPQLPSPSRDPFPTTADPSGYIPRTATEAVLARLESALREGADAVVLSGPAGSGKTLLLHILAARLDGDFHALYVPYPKLAPAELFSWILAALGSAPARDPEAALHERLVGDIEAGLPYPLLLVDDAGLAPPETLRRLEELREDLAGHLRSVLVRAEGARLPGMRASVEDVALQGRMDPAEMSHYVKTRLDRAAVDASLRARLEGAIDLLHRHCEGNPAQLHAAIARILCRSDGLARPPLPAAGH